jgi:hypothetical protein
MFNVREDVEDIDTAMWRPCNCQAGSLAVFRSNVLDDAIYCLFKDAVNERMIIV